MCLGVVNFSQYSKPKHIHHQLYLLKQLVITMHILRDLAIFIVIDAHDFKIGYQVGILNYAFVAGSIIIFKNKS